MRILLRTNKQLQLQTALPLTMIPIRIDLDIPSFIPHPALPLPSDAHSFGINPSLPAYKIPEPTLPFRLKDVFLWNLHESLITPDQFAAIMVQDLDLPNNTGLPLQISSQIRNQLEEYAGIALHPLFHPINTLASVWNASSYDSIGLKDCPTTPLTIEIPTHIANGIRESGQSDAYTSPFARFGSISAMAHPLPAPIANEHTPDETYRCIVTLNINLQDKLFTDKFEWSLLHPLGVAERFAKATCAEIGLSGEWTPATTHAIYEAVLRLKKEVCESGGSIGFSGYAGDLENLALESQEAGWRFDNEHVADEWEPKVERLSKEEIEKREGDRERQIRRLRRETTRFSSSTNLVGGVPAPGGYFDQPESADTPMGRGERSKKKRRFRSLSPQGRGGTPGARGTPDAGAAGHVGIGSLNEW